MLSSPCVVPVTGETSCPVAWPTPFTALVIGPLEEVPGEVREPPGEVEPPGEAGVRPVVGAPPGAPAVAASLVPAGPAAPTGAPGTGAAATVRGAGARTWAADSGGPTVCEPRRALPSPPPEPPNGTPLKATKAASERKTTTAPAIREPVAPVPAR